MNWLKTHLSERTAMFLIASTVGLFSGIAAHLLKLMIWGLSKLLTADFSSEGVNWWLLLLPIAGILLATLFMRVIIHHRLSHGIRRLMYNLKNQVYALGGYLTYSPIVASAVTLGFGGSAGSEGPIAYTGAAIGSNLGRAYGLRPDLLRVMIGCGAAAGIAGIFKAPVGGVLFTLEVLRMEVATVSVIMLFVSALTAALTAYILSGCAMDIAFFEHIPLSFDAYPYIVLLGLFCGLYSIYYSFVMKCVDRFFARFSRQWIKAVLAGAVVSCSVFLLPALYGEGYDVIGQIINGEANVVGNGSCLFPLLSDRWAVVIVAGAIMLLKCFAASATTSAGVAGDFAPALFAGCVTGMFFALVLNMAFGLSLPVGLFALFGMSGVMAGAIRAPLMAIFLTMEMSAGYDYLLPLAIVGGVSFGVVRLFTIDGFFSHYADRNNGIICILRKLI